MRFCFLASRDWLHPEAAGGDHYLGNLARQLVRRGHKVVFLASAYDGKSGWQRLEGVDVLRLEPGPFYPARLFVAFLRIREEIDVLVEEIFGGKKFPTLALLYPSRRLVAVWYQRHARIFSEQYPRLLAKGLSLVERFMARLYRGVPVVTLSTKSAFELSELGLDPSKIGIVPSAALMALPNMDELPGFDDREDALVFIGKIRKYKRIDHAIIALKRLEETHPRCRLVIAGNVSLDDGDYLESLRGLASRLGLEDRVVFKVYPGAIPQEEKASLLKQSKILVQPSPIEGFSMTSVEANACGTPVVVSDGVPTDAVQSGQNGLVYPFGDIDAMSKCCQSLLEQRGIWENMSVVGLKMAHRFNWDSTADSFEAFINASQAVPRGS